MSAFAFDVRCALAYLRARPRLVAITSLLLGLGIGTAATFFGIVDALYLRPLQIDRDGRVVVVQYFDRAKGIGHDPISRQDLQSIASRVTAASDFGGIRGWMPILTAAQGNDVITAAAMQPSVFTAFRAHPFLGRLFDASDDQPGRNRVVVLSHRAWRTRFAADPSVAGRVIVLEGEPYTIAGVLPPEFTSPSLADYELFVPLSNDSDYALGRRHRNLDGYARLADGATLPQLNAQLAAASAAIDHSDPPASGLVAEATPLLKVELGATAARLRFLLGGALALVLLVLVSLTILVSAELEHRSGESALRSAIGGSVRGQFRQFAIEMIVLCSAGASAATLVALATLTLFVSRGAGHVPRIEEVRFDAAVPTFAFGITILIALLLSLGAAWRARRDPGVELRSRARVAGDVSPLAVVAFGTQAGLAILLCYLTAVTAASWRNTADESDRVTPQSVALVRLRASTTLTRPALLNAIEQLSRDAAQLPGVSSVAVGSSGPFFGGDEQVEVATTVGAFGSARFANIGGDYFEGVGQTLVAGEKFDRVSESDDAVVIVADTFAQRVFGTVNVAGRQILLGRDRRPHRIVGIVRAMNEARATARQPIEIFLPFAQDARYFFFVIVRSSSPAIGNVAALRKLVASNPQFAVADAGTLADLEERYLFGPRVQLMLVISLAVVAVLIASVAAYGIVFAAVKRRSSEIGVRLAFGGSALRVGGRLLADLILRPLALGSAAGVLLVAAVAPALSAGALQPKWMAAAVVAIVAVTVAPVWRTVARAANCDPGEMLRSD